MWVLALGLPCLTEYFPSVPTRQFFLLGTQAANPCCLHDHPRRWGLERSFEGKGLQFCTYAWGCILNSWAFEP